MPQELNSLSHVVEDAVLDLIALVVAEMNKVIGVSAGTRPEGLTSYLSFEDLDDSRDNDDSRSGTDWLMLYNEYIRCTFQRETRFVRLQIAINKSKFKLA